MGSTEPLGSLPATSVDGSNLIGVPSTGLISINTDTTPAQIIAGASPNLQVNDVGNVHTLQAVGAVDVRATPPGVPQTVPDGAETVVTACTLVIGGPGLWLFFGNVQNVAPIVFSTNAILRMKNGASIMGAQSTMNDLSQTLTDIAISLAPGTLHLAGGETITLTIEQDNGNAAPVDFDATLHAVLLGI